MERGIKSLKQGNRSELGMYPGTRIVCCSVHDFGTYRRVAGEKAGWREKKIFARAGRARSSACIAVIYFKLMTERRTKFLSALRNAASFACLCRLFIVLS